MSSIRFLQTDFWRDDFFLGLSPEDKYFYLYLLTNDVTSQCGIYTLIPKFAALEIGYSEATVMTLINRFVKFGKILFNEKNKKVMILNWYKFNLNINNKNTRICMNTCLKKVKTVAFVREFFKLCMQKTENIEFVKDVFKDISMEDVDKERLAKERLERVKREMIEENEGKKCSNPIDYNALEGMSKDSNKYKNTYENEVAIDFDNLPDHEDPCPFENTQVEFNCVEFIEIIKVYGDNFHTPTPIELNDLKDWSKIFSSEVIIYAIEISVRKNNRRIQYLNGILKNWKEQGVKCLQDVKAMEEKSRSASKKDKNFEERSELKVIDYGEYDENFYKL